MKPVSVVDYGAGNLGSVLRALQALGAEARVVRDPSEVPSCGRIVFPGVGHAGQAMRTLRKTGLGEALASHCAAGKPLLGICVGMQVLGLSSEEDDTSCLGLLPFRLERFRVQEPVPHMGWNDLEASSTNVEALRAFDGLPPRPDVYFVHSYRAPLDEASRGVALATSTYGGETFLAAVAQGPLWGFQFHVEKSGRVGLALLRNFIEAY